MKQMLVCPDYRVTNPYQNLLYSEFTKDVEVSYCDYNELNHIFNYDFFHLHWVTGFFMHSSTAEKAEQACEYVICKIKEYVSQGGVFLWTIHNLVSHDSKFPEVEKRFNESLGQLAYTVFVHNESLLEIINSSYYINKEKVTLIEHGNYIDTYSNNLTRKEAREYLELEESDKVFLFLGQIRPYKGINELLTAFSRLLSLHEGVKLVVAGQPVHPIKSGEISQLCSVDNIIVHEGVINDKDLQIYFNAADFCVLPYRNILTSGSVINALSFGCPVIGPFKGALVEIIQDGVNGFLYDSEVKDSLFKVMERALQSISPEMRKESKATAESLSWSRTNKKMLDVVDSINHKTTVSEYPDLDTKIISQPLNDDFNDLPELSIIVLSYNNHEEVLKLIKSLRQLQEDIKFNIIYVDNSSSNINENLLKHYFSDCYILKNYNNYGYAKGNNIGIKFAKDYLKSRWILISNPDVEYLDNSLKNLYEYAKSNPNYIVAPLTLRNDSDKVWSAGANIDLSGGVNVNHMASGEFYYEYHDKEPYEVDYVAGSCILVNADIFDKVGYIPEEYFLYYEETDWCLNSSFNGYQPLIQPKSLIRHHKSSEPIGEPPKEYYIYYYIRNTFLFSDKFSKTDHRKVYEDLNSRFIKPWLNKISERFPEMKNRYESLVERAVADGLKNITGKSLNDEPEIELRGQLDSVNKFKDTYVASGWAMNSLDDAETLEVDLYINYSYIGKTKANLNRRDLIEAGVSETGNHGYKFVINSSYFLEGENIVTAKYKNTYLTQKPKLLNIIKKKDLNVKVRIDGINGNLLQGWVVDKHNYLSKLNFELYCDNNYIGTYKANKFRKDLEQAFGFGGKHGFAVKLPFRFLDNEKHKFSIKVLNAQGNIVLEADRDLKSTRPQSHYSTEVSYDQWLYLNRFIDVHNPAFLEMKNYYDNLKNIFLEQSSDVDEPLISIIMPTFNRVNTVEVAINSVLNQSYHSWELIISDDGSSDGTIEFIKNNFIDDRIIILENEDNKGVSAARNVAIEHSKGDLITYLDSDNYWDKDYLKIVNIFYSNYPDRNCSYAGQEVREYFEVDSSTSFDHVAFIRLGAFDYNLLLDCNYIDLNVFSHRKHLYNELGGFDEDMRRLVDWDLIVRYTKENQPIYIPFMLSHYYMGYADNQITQLESYGYAYHIFNKKREKIRKDLYQTFNLNDRALRDSAQSRLAFSLSNDKNIPVDILNLEKTITSICMSASMANTLVDIYIDKDINIPDVVNGLISENVSIYDKEVEHIDYAALIKLDIGVLLSNNFCAKLVELCQNNSKEYAYIPTTINLNSRYDRTLNPYAKAVQYLDVTVGTHNNSVVTFNNIQDLNENRLKFDAYKGFQAIILCRSDISPYHLGQLGDDYINNYLKVSSERLVKLDDFIVFT